MATRGVELLDIRDAASADGLRHMTFPAYRHLLDFAGERPAGIVAAARLDGDVAGLAVAASQDGRDAELLSVFVDPNRRRRGIATALLGRIEALCAARGCTALSATYMTGQPATQAVEALLRPRWEAPQTRMLVVRCTLDSVRDAPWLRPKPLPPGYHLRPWRDITPAQREQLAASQARDHWIPDDLVPFIHEADIEPVTSLALIRDDAIVGWCLNHVVGGVLRYTCAFVRRDLQRLARVLLLYREAVARMPQAGMSTGMWTIPVWHEGHFRFAQRWMQPYSVFFGETRGTRITLG